MHPRTSATAFCAVAMLLLARACPAQEAASDSLRRPAPAVRAAQLGLLRADRLEHASLSFTIVAGATIAGASRRDAAIATLGLGVSKEWYDRHHGGFDVVDLAADAIGVALGGLAAARR